MRRPLIATIALAGLVGIAGCSSQESPVAADQAAQNATPSEEQAAGATATLQDASGTQVGTVEFADVDGSRIEISVSAEGLTPGFHGLHLHTVGACEPNSPDPADPSKTGDFLSSGGHLAGDGDAHPDHAGDLPALLVSESGVAELTTVTDRLTLGDLTDTDGTAVVVHSGADNYGNIPTRYAAAGADDETKKAGDAGDRIACGVVEN